MLILNPKLYSQGRMQSIHQPHIFWVNMLDALYQSVIIFFLAYGVIFQLLLYQLTFKIFM